MLEGPENGDRRLLLASAAVLAVLYALFAFGDPVDDVVVFFDYSQRFTAGELPYRDFNDFYPPFAWAFILAPGLVTDDIRVYCALYAAVITILMLLTLFVIVRTCREHGISVRLAVIAYMVMTAIYYSQAIRKFDLGAVLFMAVAVRMFLNGRYRLAYPAALVGGLIKAFPFLAGLAFLVLTLRDRRAWRDTAAGFGICIVIAAVVFLPLVSVFEPSAVFNFVTGNSERGFQQESMMATISVIACTVLGMDTGVVRANSTWDVDNAICDALSGCWTVVTAASVLIVAAIILLKASPRWRDGGDEERTKLLTASLLALLIAFMLSNRVFSTQYIQWVYLPMVLLLGFRSRGDARFVMIVSFVIVFLSWSTPGIMLNQGVLLIRDLMMLYLAVMCLRYICGGPWGFAPASAERRLSGDGGRRASQP